MVGPCCALVVISIYCVVSSALSLKHLVDCILTPLSGRARVGHSHQHFHSSHMLGQFLPLYIISPDWKLQYIMESEIREKILYLNGLVKPLSACYSSAR